MDFIERVQELATRARQIRQALQGIDTEEATKNALVMPFIKDVLEYDVFNPLEVVPEFTADVGVKKGEKVDYAIMKDGKPVILFECKRVGTLLEKEQASQLYRYFSTTEVRFGVLTDGLIYRFFTDLEKPNVMDSKPFLEISLLDLDETLVEELRRFTKDSFEVEGILATASDLKYGREVKKILNEQLASPTDDFLRFITAHIYSGRVTQAVLSQFRPIAKSAFAHFINDRINERLKTALNQDHEAVPPPSTQVTVELLDTGLVTTDEEKQGFFIVKAILGEVAEPKRVYMRDQKGFCSILLDDNNRKPLCKLYFNSAKKRVGLFDGSKAERIEMIDDVNDIFRFATEIRFVAKSYV